MKKEFDRSGQFFPFFLWSLEAFIKRRTVLWLTMVFLFTSSIAYGQTRDFQQAANAGAPGYDISFLNGILNGSNSTYFEGVGIPQRIVLTGLTGSSHSLSFRHLATKGGSHAYDFIMSWEQAVQTASYIGGADNELTHLFDASARCGETVSATGGAACTALAGALPANQIMRPSLGSLPNVPNFPTHSVADAITHFESLNGPRDIEIRGNAAITAANISFDGYVAGSGEYFATYTITWTSTSSDILIRFAGHPAIGLGGGGGYGAGFGAGSVSGGPYHFKIDMLDGDPFGSVDNQVQANATPALPVCGISGPTELCTSTSATFNAPIQTGATYSWTITNVSGANPTPLSGTADSFVINSGATGGSFRVRLTVTTDGGSALCSTDVVVCGPPVFTGAPGNVTVSCSNIPAVPTVSYTNSGTGVCLIAGSVQAVRTGSAGLCGGTLTDTWSFTDSCGRTISGSRIITVDTADAASFVTPPQDTTVNCGDIPAVPTVSYTNGASGDCLISGSVLAVRTGSATICGGTITDTWSFTDNCGRIISGSRTITVDTADVAAFVRPPQDTTVNCGDIPAVPTVSYSNGASGDCLISGSVLAVRTGSATICGGTVTDTWSFTDNCGRIISGSRTITVDTADVAAFVTPPQDTTVNCGDIPAVPTVSYTNGASGDCLISGSVLAVRTGSTTICGGTITDTWSFTDNCGRTISGSRTITVDTADAAAFVTPPQDTTVNCGDIPAVPTVSYTNGASGDCLISGSVLAVRTGSATICGGTITDSWSFTDNCGRTISGSRTITVDTADAAAFTNEPGNITVDCGSVPPVPTVSYTNGASGDCLIAGSVLAIRTGSASLCGGEVTDSWSYTDNCGRQITGSRTITVSGAPPPSFVTPPQNATVDCGSIPPVPTVNYSNGARGDCLISGSVLAVRTGTYNSCGGTLTDSWSFTDNCGTTISGSRTITVDTADAAAFVTPPQDTTVDCGDIPAVPTVSYTNGASGDCLISGSVLAIRTGSAPLCGGTLTDTWSFTDNCGRLITGSRTITVNPAPAPAFTGVPGNLIVNCDSIPPVPTVNYTNGASGDCLIAGSVLAIRTLPDPLCGGTIIDSWSFTDECGRLISGSRTIIVREREEIILPNNTCTFTQGFYGNMGGISCNLQAPVPGAPRRTTTWTITNAIGTYPSLPAIPGSGDHVMLIGKLGRSVYMNNTAADVAKIIQYLPGGGGSRELFAGNVSISGNMSAYLKKGKINNTLLAQNITLGLNLGNRSELGSFELQAGWLVTADLDGKCGATEAKIRTCNYRSTDPYDLISVTNEYHYYNIDASVIAAIGADPDVDGLFALANRALGNADGIIGYEDGAGLSAIAEAVDNINKAFDGCRAFIGFNVPRCQPYSSSVPTISLKGNLNKQDQAETGQAGISVHPNPARGRFTIVLSNAIPGNKTLVITDATGREVYRRSVSVAAPMHQIPVVLNNAQGIYFIKVVDKNSVQYSRVVIE